MSEEEQEKILKMIGPCDFLDGVELEEPKEPRIEAGKEYLIGINLEEETDEYKNSIFRGKIDAQDGELIMGVRYTEHIVDFATTIEMRIGEYWEFENEEFKYYGLDDYRIIYETVCNVLHQQINDYFKETKHEVAHHKYRVEIKFSTEPDGIKIISQEVVKLL